MVRSRANPAPKPRVATPLWTIIRAPVHGAGWCHRPPPRNQLLRNGFASPSLTNINGRRMGRSDSPRPAIAASRLGLRALQTSRPSGAPINNIGRFFQARSPPLRKRRHRGPQTPTRPRDFATVWRGPGTRTTSSPTGAVSPPPPGPVRRGGIARRTPGGGGTIPLPARQSRRNLPCRVPLRSAMITADRDAQPGPPKGDHFWRENEPRTGKSGEAIPGWKASDDLAGDRPQRCGSRGRSCAATGSAVSSEGSTWARELGRRGGRPAVAASMRPPPVAPTIARATQRKRAGAPVRPPPRKALLLS